MTGGLDYSKVSDSELIAWSAKGDRRAFDEIVTRHGPFALRVALKLIPGRAEAEDIAQEAMVVAWTKAAKFDPRKGQFTTWLYRIVVNRCIDERRRIRSQPLPEHFDAEDPAPMLPAKLESAERTIVVARALQELPLRQRAAMTLVYDEGLSGAEAARILDTSIKAVERLLARARAELREKLQSEQSGKENRTS
jgi:RNA polymerase sigma-70 factor (ECF subfamily)